VEKLYSREFLMRLRNEVPMERLLCEVLNLPTKRVEGYLRFLCPLCGEFNTAVNPRTNLGRCFLCKRNFNPIDLVIAVKGCGFLTAVRFLSRLL